ncbi:hypothetical protein [Thermogutta sp.]|uniref:hypothetical protein n=1 Tax=Thermogutta sp. TaxID=1962930 RepID=UPI0032209628
MSMFEDSRYQWRETCFVYFARQRRPTLKSVVKALREVGPQYQLLNPQADAEGRFESITVVAPDAYSAMDICYVEGPEVQEDVEKQIKELNSPDLTPEEKQRLGALRHCDARFDILHFEQLDEDWGEDEEEAGDLFDPSALIVVLELLTRMTSGVAIDPQSGMVI